MFNTKLSYKEARNILDTVDLPGDQEAATNLKLAFATKEVRQNLILENENEQEVKVAAAIEIQRVWRGANTRCKLFGILHRSGSASMRSTALSSRLTQSPASLSAVRTFTPTVPHTSPLAQEHPLLGDVSPETMVKYKEYCERIKVEEGPSCVLITYTEFCAMLIQETPDLSSPSPLAESKRGDTADTDGSEMRRIIDREEAAKIIQRSWRQHIDIQVYRYYRDLINFKSRGDPSSMLKCINPREAELLDAAAGVHIKFRLAGEKFPPNIYYKIFTHRNIVDMCANAPRDYTDATTKRLPVEYIHNKGKFTEEDERLGWYQRWENNGWRLVSDRIMRRVDQDPVVYESTLKKEQFSHNKVVRRQDLERKRKKKKVEWMKKMYKEGMLKARQGEDMETEHVVQSVAEGMLTITDTRGQDAVEDWEVDELLEWTNGLNFDKYLYDWKEVATSAGSEYQAEQSKFLPDDPFSLTLMSR